MDRLQVVGLLSSFGEVPLVSKALDGGIALYDLLFNCQVFRHRLLLTSSHTELHQSVSDTVLQ